MLRRDDELRLSRCVQYRYRQCGEDVNGRIRVTEDVQRQVVREHGFAQNVREGLELLRSAKAIWPNDTEIRDAAHYLRHNIIAPCPLRLGDQIPAVALMSCAPGVGAVASVSEIFVLQQSRSSYWPLRTPDHLAVTTFREY